MMHVSASHAPPQVAACVQALPGVTSVYEWEGKVALAAAPDSPTRHTPQVQEDEEQLLFIKTAAHRKQVLKPPRAAFTIQFPMHHRRRWQLWSQPIIRTGTPPPPPARALHHSLQRPPPPPSLSTPEIIFLAIEGGSDAYLHWLRAAVAPAQK